MQLPDLSFERLIREHREIAALSDVLQRAIADGDDAPALRGALDRLSGVLQDHLETEDSQIYPQLILSADEGAAAAAREAIRAFETLANDWRDYDAAWTQSAIAVDRNGFGDATVTILERLYARVRSENELLYPLALRAAHIRLRDAA